jgi:hypothetical protein
LRSEKRAAGGDCLEAPSCKFRWRLTDQDFLFPSVYLLARPTTGLRAAAMLGELAPALLFAKLPLKLFCILLSGPTNDRGTDHQTRIRRVFAGVLKNYRLDFQADRRLIRLTTYLLRVGLRRR